MQGRPHTDSGHHCREILRVEAPSWRPRSSCDLDNSAVRN
jgi:hypothetical protein